MVEHFQHSMMDVIGEKFPLGAVHEPRKLCEVHCVQVEKMTTVGEPHHWGIHSMTLSWRHDPFVEKMR